MSVYNVIKIGIELQRHEGKDKTKNAIEVCLFKRAKIGEPISTENITVSEEYKMTAYELLDEMYKALLRLQK